MSKRDYIQKTLQTRWDSPCDGLPPEGSRIFRKFFSLSVFLVDSNIPLTLLHLASPAILNRVYHPPGYVFGRGIEWKHIVYHLMVEQIHDLPFYIGKISYHPIPVKLACLAFHGDYPVVSVQLRAFAFVAQ